MEVENLNSYEKDLLLRWFLNHMPQDRRKQLMDNYPQLYNKLVGHEMLKVVRNGDPEPENSDPQGDGIDADKAELETKLRSYRRRVAEERGWPPYRVFTEGSLRHLVESRPADMEALSKTPGFGPRKLDQFGEDLLKVIKWNGEVEAQ